MLKTSVFYFFFQVTIINKSPIEHCKSVTDPHYSVLHPKGNGRLVILIFFMSCDLVSSVEIHLIFFFFTSRSQCLIGLRAVKMNFVVAIKIIPYFEWE